MDIFEYDKRLSKLNFNYRELKNPQEWQEQRKEYERCMKMSYDSPAHRKIWLMRRENFRGGN